jgi:hypothetical protein
MVTRKEHRWIIIFSIIVMAITTLPYILGFESQGTNWYFTGFLFGVEDGNSYIAKMLSGEVGSWLFKSPYTAYPQTGFLAFLPYIILGKVAAEPGLHDQLVVLFHLYRILSGILCIIATYDFISVFITDYKLRRLGTAIATIGGGLGWLSVIGFGNLWQMGMPLEFYSPESFGFLALLGLPHLAMARAFLLWGLVGYLKPIGQHMEHGKNAIGYGLLWFLLGLMQPLTVVIGWAVLSSHLILWAIVNLYKEKTSMQNDWPLWKVYLKRALIMIAISSPIVLYTFVSFQYDSYLKEWSRQNIILSPHVMDYLLAYAILLPFAIAGVSALFRQNQSKAYLIFSWVLIFPLLAYFPYNLQRRLPEAIWVSLAILAMSCLMDNNRKFLRKMSWLLYSVFIIPLILLVGSIFLSINPGRPIFIQKEERAALIFLAEHVKRGDVLLASYEISNDAPAWAPVQVLIGHGPESIHLATIKPQVDLFFQSATPDTFRQDLINKFNIRYILIGPSEEQVANWVPAQDMNASLEYDQNGWKLFKVNQPLP